MGCRDGRVSPICTSPPFPSMSPDPVLYPQLVVANLAAEGAASTGPYRNVVVNRVNESCLRLSTFEGDYPWHFHPDSDELFVVVDGQLAIDLADGSSLQLGPWDMVTIPAGTIHRSRALPRAINLCFEHFATETTFVEPPVALESEHGGRE
jgi:mannose-6-phosphate isomerase-like protein (cupin superfamily)